MPLRNYLSLRLSSTMAHEALRLLIKTPRSVLSLQIGPAGRLTNKTRGGGGSFTNCLDRYCTWCDGRVGFQKKKCTLLCTVRLFVEVPDTPQPKERRWGGARGLQICPRHAFLQTEQHGKALSAHRLPKAGGQASGKATTTTPLHNSRATDNFLDTRPPGLSFSPASHSTPCRSSHDSRGDSHSSLPFRAFRSALLSL